MEQKQRPPRHLLAATRRWWTSVVESYELEPHHIHLLTLACEALDRGAAARKAIEAHGMATATRDGGLKLSPYVRVENDCRLSFARLLRELDLDVDPPATAARPPVLRSMRGRTDAA